MFKDLQRLFRRSVDAFREELNRAEPEDQVAELLSSMRRELVEARAALPLLAQEVERTRAELAAERQELERCVRREAMAQRIGDEETARIAGEFGGRHQERIAVLEKKVEAAEAERALREQEAQEMKRRYQEADANRFALLAQLRQTASRERMRSRLDGTDGAFSDWSRMEEKIEGEGGTAEALRELDEELGGGAGADRTRPTEAELEARLAELKRRMGR